MAVYVSAKFGNDSLGDGSKENPFQTITKGVNSDSVVYILDGKYIEYINRIGNYSIYGKGNVVIEGTVINNLVNSIFAGSIIRSFFYVDIINFTDIKTTHDRQNYLYYSYIKNCGLSSVAGANAPNNTAYSQNVFNTTKTLNFRTTAGSSGAISIIGCSFYGSGIVQLYVHDETYINYYLNNIFHSKLLQLYNIYSCQLSFNHFYSCNIDIVPDTYGSIIYDGSVPYNESSPDLSTQNDLRALRERAAAYYGGVYTDYFPNCAVYDASTTDCFVDETLGIKEGFYLKPTSPSSTANYITGKYIGALPVARGLIFPTGFTYGSNIQADGTLLDPNDNTEANNTIEYTDVFDHTKVILVECWGEGIINAERNGDYSSIDKDTSDTTLGDTDTLTNTSSYVCETESLSVSDGTDTINLAVGEVFYCPDDGLTYTISATNGVLREIYTEKRPTLYSKFSRTDSALSTATYLKFYQQAYDGVTAMPPMMLVDGSGVPVLGDADTGFQYTGHPTYGDAIRVQMRYEKRKSIIQVENAKS